MKIYTKKGDAGKTQLLGGTKTDKHDDRIEAYGNVDELNAFIGHIHDQKIRESHKEMLLFIQNKLFCIGSMISFDGSKEKIEIPKIHEKDVSRIEKEIDLIDESLPPIKNFILPSGHPLCSLCHIARTICRRSERSVSLLSSKTMLDKNIIIFLNRLSDYLFILSRSLLIENNGSEVYWK